MYDLLLILHFIGITLSVGTGFAFMALGMGTKDMALPERGAFMLRAFVIGRNGSVGLVLLLLSGIGMVLKQGGFAIVAETYGWPLRIKMILVLIIICLVGYMESLMKKAKRDKGGPVMAKIPKVGPVLLFTALCTIVCAVLAFH